MATCCYPNYTIEVSCSNFATECPDTLCESTCCSKNIMNCNCKAFYEDFGYTSCTPTITYPSNYYALAINNKNYIKYPNNDEKFIYASIYRSPSGKLLVKSKIELKDDKKQEFKLQLSLFTPYTSLI